MGEAFSKLGINGIFLLGQIVNFLILFIALRFLLWKPLMGRLDERRERLKKEKANVEALEESRENIASEKKRILAEAKQEAREIVAEGNAQVDEITKSAKAEANRQAEEILTKARQQSEEERNQTLGKMRGQISALAIAAAQRIIGEKLDEERQRALVDEFFSGVRSGKVQVLPDALKAVPEPFTVTSAIPLEEEEKNLVRRNLVERLGDDDFELSFRVDPDIMGGLIIQAGDFVVDGSVSGQLEKLQESLV